MSSLKFIKNLSSESIMAIIAVSLVLVPLIAFSTFSFHQVSKALTNILKKELEAKSVLVTSNIDSFILERIIDVKTISQADVLEGIDSSAKNQYLKEIVTENNWINDLEVIDESGIITSGINDGEAIGKQFLNLHPIDPSLLLTAYKAQQGQVFVSEAVASSLYFITPITGDTNTKKLGLIVIEVSLKHIVGIVALFDQGIIGDKYVYIVDNDGKVIVSSNPSTTFLAPFPDLQTKPELLDAFSLQGEIGNIIYTDHAGDEVMAGYADMNEFGENKALDWSLIAIAPMDEITAPVTNLKQLLFIIGSLIALLAVYIAYRSVDSISINLGKLAKQADAISQGNYSVQKLNENNRKGAFSTLVIAINQMQTNLHQLINDLKDREQRLNITLNSIGDGVIATDEKGNVTRMNPIAEKLTAWTVDEAKGLSLKEIFPIIDENSRQAIDNPVDKVLATGETVYLSNSTILQAKDGSEYQIEDSAAPILSEDNSIHGMILIFSDVTRRKRAELRYRQNQKMDALGKLTGGIAHDYNNILGVIIGYCDLLSEDLKDQPEARQHLDTILTSALRGADLTRKLLDFSKQKPAKVVTLNIADTVQNQRLMLQKTLTVRIDLVFDFPKDLWSVQLDESDLIDALLNICINAMHAIDETGKITIKASNESLNQTDANVLGIAPGDYVLLSITDTGCGMDANTKKKIYDPFFTTKGKKGTGLGLSQAYGFMQRSMGAIKAYSELGHGTQQILYFPRHLGVEINKSFKKSALVDKNFNNETILVVDDEKDLLQFCNSVLKKNGFNVFTAENGRAALDILERESVDLLLSDIIMPGMTGYQLSSIVKEKYPMIKIQLASGFADEREDDTIDDDLKSNCLLKPYNTKALLAAINHLLNSE